MSCPSSTYEKQLLARSERLERGLPRALSAGAAPPDSYQDDGHDEEGASESLAESIKLHEAPRRISEEELFIIPLMAPSILSLPDELRRHANEIGHKLVGQSELACLSRASESKACRMARLLSEFLEEEADP